MVPELETAVKLYYPHVDLVIVQLSPVVGCHAGPGLIGFAVY
ncbi:MAG TPA: hypothetical protein DF296_11735 [Candidatus Margulisbacteria bacterium]|nr:hypothetical protein [Candidatus Margulisiibacteriota bacterium]HCT85852.1 hypothetical protein [Candidatus Margulisiibacteriota bacterium]HCY37637.1 hypothetical protein [Candidatus Margulisiibacteriota bacterium]